MIISTIDNKEAKKELQFPKLMIYKSGEIVLFLTEKSGVSIRSQSVGKPFYSTDWDISEGFTEFKGSITLRNEV